MDTATHTQMLETPNKMFIVNPYRPGTAFTLIDSGLIGRWVFDEGSGTTAADYTGNNDGTLVNMDGSDWVTGPGGLPALDFDGTNDYVTMADIVETDGLSAISLCAHINTADVTTYAQVISKYNIDGNQRVWFLGIFEGKVYCGYSTTGTDVIWWLSDAALSTSTDHHIGCSMNLTTGVAHLYVDGTEETSYKNGTGTGTTPNKTSDALIGANDDDSGPLNHFGGEIADPRIYNRILSDAEFASIAAQTG